MTTQIAPPAALPLLASLPHQVGFTPRDSLVLVPVSGTHTRGVLRIDLPQAAQIAQTAATAIGYACRVPDVESVVIVIYTDGPVLDGAGVAHEDLVALVGDRAEACGLRVVGELCVAADGWASYDEAAPRPLSEIAEADPDRELRVEPSQWAGVDIAVSEDEIALVRPRLAALSRLPGDAFHRLADGATGTTGLVDVDAHLAAFDADPYALAERLVADDTAPDAAEVALWAWILRSPALRDVVLTQWVGDADEARMTWEWQASWLRGETRTPDFAVRIAGEGPRPDSARLERARDAVRSLVARTPDSHRASLLAVCGWLSWALGGATHAARYAQLALDLDPQLSFASLVARMTDGGMIPGWAYDPEGSPLAPSWWVAQPAT